MVEGTRSQDIKRIEESIRGSEKQAEVMNEMSNLVAALHLKCEQIAEKVSQSSSEPAVSLSPACSSNGNNWYTRFAKIEFPKFYGDDIADSVDKCEKFFEFNAIAATQKAKLALVHREDRVIQWYRWFEKSHTLKSWKDFSRAIVLRFG